MAEVAKWGIIAGCERRIFDRASAAAIVAGELQPARRFFRANAELFGAALEVRVGAFEQRTLKDNPDNYGVYFTSRAFSVPFFWFGLGWGRGDPAETLLSWGASLEINGGAVAAFKDNAGGLRAACEAAAGSEELQLHRFAEHVELAAWRSFDWLLGQPDQRLALERFWLGYLDLLVTAELPTRIAAFVQAAR